MVFCFIYPEIKARLDRLVFRIPFSYYEGQGDLDTMCIIVGTGLRPPFAALPIQIG